GDISYRDNDARIAVHVDTDGARILGIDIAADRADLDLLERGLHGGRERRHDLLALLDQEQRRAPRRARAEPRQAGEQLDQAFDLGPGDGGGHTGPLAHRTGDTQSTDTALGIAAENVVVGA